MAGGYRKRAAIPGRRLAGWVLAVLLGLGPGGGAEAHHRSEGRAGGRAEGRADGIAIPSLNHHQLGIMADYRPAVLALADRQISRDDTALRLRNYADIQRMACLWGLMPGSLSDEDSPFNECSHAYLSATYALLRHLAQAKAGPERETSAGKLLQTVDEAMIERNAVPVICAFSSEPFNTAEVVSPPWNIVPSHRPSFLALAAFTLVVLSGVAGLGAWLFRRPTAAARRPLS